MKNFEEFGLEIPEILLPKDKNLEKWSVIACDQYTQDVDYWKRAAEIVGSAPSTLNIILPEVYLSSPDRKERIEKIRSTMRSYLNDGTFDPPKKGFVYVERKTGYGRIRHGLVAAVDLDAYEWKPMSSALVRATEATIVDRIPPRKEIRRDAPVESPHIMLLVNDPEHKLVEAAGDYAKKNMPVYDGDLMQNAGHITGWMVSSESEINRIYEALDYLKKAGTASDGSSFLFAVGDGNHSLATAKAVWDEYREELRAQGKSKEEIASSPVRYALVEIVNIYDTGLTFEPIHRVLFNIDAPALELFVKEKLGGVITQCDSERELEQKVRESKASFGFVHYCDECNKTVYECLETPVTELAVSRLQPVLDAFIAQNTEIQIDYIHGSDEVFRLGQKKGAVSILLPPVAKDSFFDTINKSGPLPRKSFSMGEASEKRFYLECRALFR